MSQYYAKLQFKYTSKYKFNTKEKNITNNCVELSSNFTLVNNNNEHCTFICKT